MAGKRKSGKGGKAGKKKAAAAPKRSYWWLKISLVGVVLAAIVLVYLDAVVRSKFEGKRWSLPAKVYARPLELYAGLHMSRSQLMDVLDQLGYRPTDVGAKLTPGTFRQFSSGLEVYTRGFNFGEGAEDATPLRLNFEGDTVTQMTNAVTDHSVDVRRLEPQVIGGIYPRQNEDRVLVQLKEVPKSLIDTLTAVEDRDYWEHSGISFRGITRAMIVNISQGKLKQGGSTLTQQLVKNFWLTSERSFVRKLLEMPMAFLLELHYSKQEILEAYLNEIYLAQSGNREIHGFGLASQYYFAQPLNELKLHQIALLVGMVRGPSYYEPRRNPERALMRRNTVLDVLREQGMITTQEWADAREKPLGLEKTPSYSDARY
ncbi:MAG TPA: transglycosylase domain-containing protein, partial [Pseudomonadales bacterium]|nr:transglycosylase domain-containing protein [Pseudomonadales bacterium]